VRSALETGRLLAAGELDAEAECEVALERAAAAGPAFTRLTAERARAEARAAAARLRAGEPASPLDGVPVAWKDLVDVAGTPTTAASDLRRELAPAAADAPAVARLASAGLVCVGKTNLSELAFSGLGLNPHFGTPPNRCRPASQSCRRRRCSTASSRRRRIPYQLRPASDGPRGAPGGPRSRSSRPRRRWPPP